MNLSILSTTNGLPVTSIGDNAFYNCTSLTSVTMPDSITNLGSDAFGAFTSLSSVTIGHRVPSIRGGTFSGCTSLTSVTIPDSVTNIENSAFQGCASLASVTIDNSVTNIGEWALSFCSRLHAVYFQGNAPLFGGLSAFYGDNYATVYHLPGTTGWGSVFAACPAVLWNPQVQTSGASFGVRTDRFGFTITGTTNIPIVVEACTNLASASWTSLQSCTLTNGSIYFSDPQWTNYPGRFYRLRSPRTQQQGTQCRRAASLEGAGGSRLR